MRLLFFSDSPTLSSGYGNIAKHMGRELTRRGVEVGYASLQHPPSGKLRYEVLPDIWVPFYGATPPGEIRAAVRDFKPDITLHVRDFIAHDERRIGSGAYKLRGVIETGKIWGWLPYQQAIAPIDHAECCWNEYDLALMSTEHGMREYGNLGFPRDRMRVLPWGVSPAFSEPEGPVLDWGRSPERAKLPLGLSISVNNDPRKMLPFLMLAYSKVAGKFDMDWWIHSGPKGSYDLEAHIRAAGVPGRWLFPTTYPNQMGDHVGWTEERLASLYRAASVYVPTGTGEGSDLPSQEAACMGLPVIFGDLPNRVELLGEYEGVKIPVKTHLYPRTADWESLPDVDALADAFARIPDLKRNPDAGRRFYERRKWSKVADEFMRIAAAEGAR